MSATEPAAHHAAITITGCARGALDRGACCIPESAGQAMLRLMRAILVALLLLLTFAGRLRADSEPARRDPARSISPAVAAVLWGVVQFVPSPVLVTGSEGYGGGMRWQLTLLTYAFGLQSHRLRSIWVPPVARHAGALELYVSPAWLCCAPDDRTSWMLNGGARMYLPLEGRGENLAASLGASYYRASPGHGAAFELAVYVLSSLVGLSVTVAPWLTAREVSTALTLRYY
jgi:hypothetical protein